MRTVTFDETQWKLVPIELTQEMRNAWDRSPNNHEDDDINVWMAYDAMISASPPYPESNFVESLDSWIPVSERLPDHRNSVLCYAVNINGKVNIKNSWLNPIMSAFYVDYIGDEPCEVVTHWMPLPAAPKGEE